jgi:flagellar hook-associated protein 2
VSSPITFSGFNNIDFGVILTSMMKQASQPLTDLQTTQSNMATQVGQFKLLATRVSNVQAAAEALSTSSAVNAFGATSSDSNAVAVAAGTSAIGGHYDVVVKDLARAQVMASVSGAPDADTTVVASGGTLLIGGQTVTLTGAVTLSQLADAINAQADMPVNASVVQAAAGSYRLVLTASSAGEANSFTVTNGLTAPAAGPVLAFNDENGDHVSGDVPADNAVNASNASLTVNNIQITSASNTVDGAIPGVTLSLFKKDLNATISVDVAADSSALKSKLTSFVTAYNDLMKFVSDQSKAAATGDATSIGRDPVIRQLRNGLRAALSSSYATGGIFDNLSQVGVEFTQAGTLQVNGAMFTSAVKSGRADFGKLFAGGGGVDGAFAAVRNLMTDYSQSSGFLASAEDRLTQSITRLGARIDDMSTRLAAQRVALQAQFTAADNAMSQLNSQGGSLTSFAASLKSNS